MFSSLTIEGFKSIRCLRQFETRPLNVLIGANGAGKSNLLSFFRMMSFMLGDAESLPGYVARHGGASRLLFGGPEKTPQIKVHLRFDGTQHDSFNEYAFRLAHASGDSLIFVDESFRYSYGGNDKPRTLLGAGHSAPKLLQESDRGNQTARAICNLLRLVIYHQFHNTSATSRMRSKWSTNDSRHLKEDAANLAPFLLRLREQAPPYYARIRNTVAQILPWFGDFELEDEYHSILLRWTERGTDLVFDASQASDGTLRVFALIALLLQPPKDLPRVIILDEPELGLHPAAVNLVGALIRSAAAHTQLFVATQSSLLVDCFDPEDVVVVDRDPDGSRFQRLDSTKLQSWLEDYSLSEIWEKNVVGGRP
jgi:predicted ATPase